jgi:hypothetical protein
MPILKMRLVKDGRNDFRKFWIMMENCAITFSMKRLDNGIFKIANVPGRLILKPEIPGDTNREYFIGYDFQVGDTDETGVFVGEFNIIFYDSDHNNAEIGNLKVPIQEELYIHVVDSFTTATTIY